MTASTSKSSGRRQRSKLLGGRDIGTCLTKIHHDRFTEGIEVDDPVRQSLIQRGFEYEARVLDRVLDGRTIVSASASDTSFAAVEVVDVDRRGGLTAAAAITSEAMAAGVSLVVNGWLVDEETSRVGAPDLLVRLSEGYAAVDVKNHLVTSDKGIPGTSTPVDDLSNIDGAGVWFRSNRRRDLYQVAHYWDLLRAAGHGTAHAIGGVIGSDEPMQCVWVDLDSDDGSIVDDVNQYTASAQHAIDFGTTHQAEPLELPFWRGECTRCDWRDLCRTQLIAADDISLLPGISRDAYAELRADGIDSIADVAALDPATEGPIDGVVVLRARARVMGKLLRSSPGVEPLPLVEVRREVDLDLETYRGRVYLAGLLTTTNRSESTFKPIVDWTGTSDGEALLIADLFREMAGMTDTNTVVFHWTDYEQRVLQEAAERHNLTIEGYRDVGDWFDRHAVDLCEWSRTHLTSPQGYSLKVVAPLAGFNWRDDDPGGLQSELWFEGMLAGDTQMQNRILTYNEDDVLAQLAIRRFIRDADSGEGPGSAMTSALAWPPPDLV